MRPQLLGIDVDLILLDEAADAGDFRYPLDGLQLISDIPILQRAKLTEVLLV